jgi:O-succinylbenzoic acid--CoA ligase
VPALVAVLAHGPRFVDILRQVWEGGDAVLPIDPRLPGPARAQLLELLAPSLFMPTDGRLQRLDGRQVAGGDALVVATSGTTGQPKGVVLTHDAVAASARATSDRLGVSPGADHWLACLPLAHVGGLSVVTRALLTSTPLTVHERFDVAEVTAAARQPGGPTLVSLVATALARLDAGLFRVVVLGGSAPPSSLPANAVTTYGMTETGSGVVYDGIPLDGVEVRIVAGQIQLRGAMLGRAYRVAGSEMALTDADGWLATGDGGELTDGRLTVHGRLAEVIVSGGEKIWPATVEPVLLGHPKVAEVAVVGVPDPDWGQRVVAVVVATGPTPPALADLRDLVKTVLPAYAAPRQLVVTASLPTTALGKIRRDVARSLVREAMTPAELDRQR